MLDLSVSPGSSRGASSDVAGTPIEQSLAAARQLSERWRDRAVASIAATSPQARWLTEVPDVGPTCEVLLADRLFHDLSPDESTSMLAWVRASQDASGAWMDLDGNPDLSLTVLGWWARRCGGDAADEESMVRAQRVVHALGGAQRANFEVRLWLALCGAVPWDFLPAIPGELFLLPESVWLSPSQIAPWARGILTAYYVIARGNGQVQLPDPAPLMLRRDPDAKALVSPRLTRPGLAGDLLQAFDRTVKLSRKLPRGPVPRWAVARATASLEGTRQRHGGWFSTRPTLLALLALRVHGVPSNDPRVLQGLEQLRASRGKALVPGGVGRGSEGLAQGLGGTHLRTAARLTLAAPEDSALTTLLRMELTTSGPWQDRANALAGGWPHEPGADHHLDLAATCSMLALLGTVPEGTPLRAPAWAARRRAVDILLAMQEGPGSFARFERGEADVFMRKLPWSDADLLGMGERDDAERVALTGHVLTQLGRTGFRIDDDRVARGVSWIERTLESRASTQSLAALSALGHAAVATCPKGHGLRKLVEQQLRSRQREDGSFGDAVETAHVLSALLALGGPCVQAHRAARHLAAAVQRDTDALERDGGSTCQGFGLSPRLGDPSAPAREVSLALATFVHHTSGALAPTHSKASA